MRQIPQTIVEAFGNPKDAEQIRNKYAISSRDISYKSLLTDMRRLAGVFKILDLSPGDRLLYSISDDHISSSLFLACLNCGITAVLVDPETRQIKANDLVERSDPQAIIIDDKLAQLWQLDTDCPVILLGRTFTLGSKLFGKQPESSTLHGMLAITDEADLPQEIDQDSDAYIIFTSGSTAQPKGVCITHRALFAHLKTMTNVFELHSGSRMLNTFVLSHPDGLISGPLLAACNAASWARSAQFRVQDLDEIIDMIIRDQITHFICNPTIISLMCRLGSDSKDIFASSKLEYVVSSSAFLDPYLWEEFETKFGIKLVNMYGLTETVVAGLFCGPSPSTYKRGTVGKPADLTCRIVDDYGNEVKCNWI